MTDTTPAQSADVLAERLKSDSPVPADCPDEELALADFARRDVLIGTVRSDAQFDHTVASLSYYAPVKVVPAHELPVRLVALYEEGLTRRGGIKRYGEVAEIRVVRRDEIPVPLTHPNGDEAYYLFTVRSWEYLDHPISIEGTSRGRPAFTSEFLLTHARRSYQLLCIHSPAEYRLTQALCRLLEDAVHSDGSPVLRRLDEYHLLGAAEGALSLIHARGEVLFRCPLRAMQTDPAEVLHRVAVCLGVR